MWGLDEKYGAGVASLSLAARAATATTATLTVQAGAVVDAFVAIGAYTDGSHLFTVEYYDGSGWVTLSAITGSGSLPTIDTAGEASTVHCASFLVPGDPGDSVDVRLRGAIVNATTGAAWSVLLRQRQMIIAVV